MRWLVWREVLVFARSRALWAAVAAELSVLGAFVIVWSDGVPGISGTVADQFQVVHTAALGVLMPWVSARCGVVDRVSFTSLGLIAAEAPSHIVLARVAGAAVASAVLTTAALPVTIIAMQIAEAPMRWLMGGLGFHAALAVCSASVTTACMLAIADRLTAWITATLVTLIAIRMTSSFEGRTIVLAVAGILLAVTLAHRTSRV
jgi:hypothetical protein